jgi:2-polyprenyl-3-methyl-5-hydroxy-6-metoxy-1,4-benzoquinol methylase
MDYAEQKTFLRQSRIWGSVSAVALFGTTAICMDISGGLASQFTALVVLLTAALAIFIYYTPDYLHLTVMLEKRSRWAVRIRWRLIAAALILGLLLSSTNRARISVLLAIGVLVAANLLALRFARRFSSVLLAITDCALLATLFLCMPISLPLETLLIAMAMHLVIVTADRSVGLYAAIASGAGTFLILIAGNHQSASIQSLLSCIGMLAVTTLATLSLVLRAERHNARNIELAAQELIDFTGYPIERIRQLWAVSNQELAKNWQAAEIAENDSARLADWYKQNSDLYLFALSGYNLEYKRIRSNLNVLKLGRGSCLDYGAGNGEILLALAAQGHRAAYFDVEGETMKFARQRAMRRNLPLKFFPSKEELAASDLRYDTIYSLDVLEHLPDLAGELDFLASMLNAGGLLVFDVPAGATKAHPMHLNHSLDVVAYLGGKGLRDERNFWQWLPFRKEEKYFFRSR